MSKISRAVLFLVMIFIGCAHVNSSQDFSNSKDSLTESAGVKEFVSPPFRLTSDASLPFRSESKTIFRKDLGSHANEGAVFFCVEPQLIGVAVSKDQEIEANNDTDNETDMEAEEEVKISDPIEPFNRAMFVFNDRLYFWVLKPVAQKYSDIVPERARTGIDRFFENLKFPIRFVNNLLQANLSGAFSELGRFTVNTIWGIGGFLDPASKEGLELRRSDADFGQSLGVYGLGQGFYIVWPVLGPSSVRDSVGLVGDYFLYPVSYISPIYASVGVRAYSTVNNTSLRIGDYESLKEAAIDPYVSLKNAYAQYREKKISLRASKTGPPKPGGVYD